LKRREKFVFGGEGQQQRCEFISAPSSQPERLAKGPVGKLNNVYRKKHDE
jgi:hypothetical protein